MATPRANQNALKSPIRFRVIWVQWHPMKNEPSQFWFIDSPPHDEQNWEKIVILDVQSFEILQRKAQRNVNSRRS